MGTTSLLQLPYPDDSDPIAEGAGVVKLLAQKVESLLMLSTNKYAVDELPTSYPQAASLMQVSAAYAAGAGGWPYGTAGQVLTVKTGTDRASQIWFRANPSTTVVLVRSSGSTGSTVAWSPWTPVAGPGVATAVATGEVVFADNTGAASKTVSFPAGRFTDVPIITTSCRNRDATFAVTGISASGFTANIGGLRTDSLSQADRTMYYQAIQMGPVF